MDRRAFEPTRRGGGTQRDGPARAPEDAERLILFGRKKGAGAGPSQEQANRAAESLAAIEAGGLPLAARERMTKVGEAGPGFYSTNLSTNEFLFMRQAGFRPITQVMGSCFYNVGWQLMPGGFGYTNAQIFELDAPTQAWQEARRLALSRLAEEARLAGADAVVGVRFNRNVYQWAHGVIEFSAVGTAVRSEQFDIGDAKPVLSNLSGQDFAKLFANGYWPVGIVAGTTVMYAMTGWSQRVNTSWGGFSQNQELPDFTRGVHAARQAAMQRVHSQAAALDHPAGLVGMRFDLTTHEVERKSGFDSEVTDMMVIVHALGTAIVQLQDQVAPSVTSLALSL